MPYRWTGLVKRWRDHSRIFSLAFFHVYTPKQALDWIDAKIGVALHHRQDVPLPLDSTSDSGIQGAKPERAAAAITREQSHRCGHGCVRCHFPSLSLLFLFFQFQLVSSWIPFKSSGVRCQDGFAVNEWSDTATCIIRPSPPPALSCGYQRIIFPSFVFVLAFVDLDSRV